MELFFQQFLSGLAHGSIYGLLGLAIVVVYKATDQINFSQGEMAMFSTFVAWTLLKHGLPFWLVYLTTIVLSFIAGYLLEHFIYRPVEQAHHFTKTMVVIALLLIINGAAGFFFGYTTRSFPSPFSNIANLNNKYIGNHEFGSLIVISVLIIIITLFFKMTRLGLTMRAVSQSTTISSLMGIRVKSILALSWGIAASIGAIAGLLIAPEFFLDPNTMINVVSYSFAATVIGGINSPLGAVCGGMILGITENLLGTYLPFIGQDLKSSVALFLMIIFLIFKPTGLFGDKNVYRV